MLPPEAVRLMNHSACASQESKAATTSTKASEACMDVPEDKLALGPTVCPRIV
jgi:hypothetical protein